jgi:hypothetical protein
MTTCRILASIACIGLLSCMAKSEDRSPGPAATPAVAKAAEAESGEEDVSKSKDGLAAKAMVRKIIRDGEVSLVVKAYAPARQQIERMVREAGGYISKTEVHHSLGQVSSATLVLRVPAGKFGGIVGRILRLGVVQRESMSSRDITEAYYDLKARLDNARKLEARLLDLLAKKTGKVSDLLQVERELARVRESIERFEGKLRLYDNLVDLSTLTVNLSIQQKYTPPRPPSLGDDIRETLGGSWDALKGFGRGLVLALVALVPWALPLVVLVWLVIRWWRRRRQRRQARTGQ